MVATEAKLVVKQVISLRPQFMSITDNLINFQQECKANLILIIMSHDLNLINANYASYLNPLTPIKNEHQTRLQPYSFNSSTISNQNLYSFNSIDNNFNQNYTKYTEKTTPQVDQALNQNHRALKNLIDMIDNRKTKNTVTGLSFNKTKEYQRMNRFNRKSNEELKRERKNFVEDLKEVKQKMNEIMRLIDIKIKVNQQQAQNHSNLVDFDVIKQKLTVQSAKLDILQRDNSNKQSHIHVSKAEEKMSPKHKKFGSQNENLNAQTIANQSNIVEKTEDQQCLHLKHSFDKLNNESLQENRSWNNKNKDEVIHWLPHNKLNSDNIVEFFTKEQKEQKKRSIQYLPSQKTSIHNSPQISQLSYKQRMAAEKKLNSQSKSIQRPDIQIRQPLFQHKTPLQRSKSVDNKSISSNFNNHIKIVYKPSNINLNDSNISNRFINTQTRLHNPNSFGRPTSNIILHQNTQTLNRAPLPILNRPPPIFNFSPPPAHYPSPPLPYRSQQKAIIRQWDEESRPDLSFGLSSSISTHRNGQSATHLKKSSKNSQKFSFIEHFANNPDARKRRQESMIKNQQVKESIVEYGFPKMIPRQPNAVIQNPFQDWNKQFNMQKKNLRQEIQVNDNSMRTIIQTSEPKNKDSIIHQASFFDSSKSGSKPSKIDLPKQLMEAGSAYKKKKKGLQVSKRMNQKQYYPKY